MRNEPNLKNTQINLNPVKTKNYGNFRPFDRPKNEPNSNPICWWRWDGTRTATYFYGCGGYISKGKSICQMNPIPQEELENKVIDAVLNFYRPYLEKDGRQKLAQAVKEQTGFEKQDIAEARQRATTEQERITRIIDNLLDNITPANREHVDKRLNQLNKQRQRLETKLEELERLSISQVEIE